ncbi:MAG: KEOPS complex subunit Pcc1 [Sulfolobales archaeon]
MRITLLLDIGLRDNALASAVYKALKPDDAEVPKGFRLSSSLVNSSITYELVVDVDERSKLYTLYNVVDDVIQHTSLAISVINSSVLST